jgi:hypothetical protein
MGPSKHQTGTPGQTGPVERDPADSGERRRVRPRAGRPRAGDPAEPPALPSRSSDDLDTGWGEDVSTDGPNGESGGRDAEWYRRQRPPHHE